MLPTCEFLRCEISDNVALVTVDRPPVNAYNLQLYTETRDLFTSLGAEPGVHCVVFTGGGSKAFVAGNDIHDFLTMTYENSLARMGLVRQAFEAIYDCSVPVIGAINGYALGTGLALAACCDFLVASDSAQFALPEINVGVLGGFRHLMRLVPQGWARLMHLTGRRLSAEEMRALGAVVQVAPAGQEVAAALAIAREIAAKSPLFIKLCKRNMDAVEWMDLKDGYKLEQSGTSALATTEDSKEAQRAFFERRPPVYKGR